MGKMKRLTWIGLALVAMTSPIFGQQETIPTIPANEEVKMIIIKKVIDDKGVETIERIEKQGTAQEMRIIEETHNAPVGNNKTVEINVEIKGLEKMDSDRVKSLEKTLNKVVEIDNLNLDIEVKELKEFEKTEDVLFMFKEAKETERPFLGVTIEIHEAGVKITEVTTSSAAEAAGLHSGDVIKEIQGQKIASVEALQAAIRSHKVGETIKIAYLRDNNPAYTDAVLKSKNTDTYIVRSRHTEKLPRHDFYQAKSVNFDPCKKLEELQGTPFIGVFINTEAEEGAGVLSVIDNTGAAASKLQAGDIITKLNSDIVTSYSSLEVAKKKHKPGDVVRITYLRDGKKGNTRLTLGSMGDREPRQVRALQELCEQQAPAETEEVKTAKEEVGKLTQVPSAAALDVFPNPAKDIVTLQFNGGSNAQATISVLTIEGKEVMRREVNQNTGQFTEQLDLSKLAAGMYIVTVKQGDTVISKQVALKSN